jgi:hypothetical protein
MKKSNNEMGGSYSVNGADGECRKKFVGKPEINNSKTETLTKLKY